MCIQYAVICLCIALLKDYVCTGCSIYSIHLQLVFSVYGIRGMHSDNRRHCVTLKIPQLPKGRHKERCN